MKKYILFSIIVFSALWFLGSASAQAAACSWSGNTGTVASPYAASDINACITDASSKTGDVIIQIPSSSVTWGSTVTVNMTSGFTNVTGLTIRGQSDCALDYSEITTGIPTSCGTNIANMSLVFTGSANKRFRLAHLRLTGSANSGNAIYIDGDSAYPDGGWRIDHIFFDTLTPSSRIIWFGRNSSSYGLSNGLIHNCYILNPNIIFLQYQPSRVDGGNQEWMTALGLGTANAIYIEDSKFYVSSGLFAATESQGGGRFVVRHSIIHNGFLDAHDAIVNGLRGIRKFEAYNNTFTYDANAAWVYPFYPRSGSGVFFNNTISDPTGSIADTSPYFSVYRTYQTGGNPWGALCSNTTGKAILDISSNYPQTCTNGTGCINIDGSSSNPNGYPCRDQLGVDSNNPQVAGAAPFLIWNNSITNPANPGGTTHLSPHIGGTASYVVAGRDYCLASDWVTQPTTCNGITVSTYWPGPYTYPHPLRSETPQTCTYAYSAWEACQSDNTQTRTVISSSPSGCTGTPVLTQSCIYTNFLPEQYVEAESGTLSLPMQIGSDSSASGGSYVSTLTDNSGSVSFTFNITTASQYIMQAKINSNNDGGQNSFYVGLDGEAAQNNNYYTYSTPVIGGFVWDDVNRVGNGTILPEFDPMTWALTAGTHTFTFYGREANTWLDQIILKRVTADTTPPAAPTGLVVI